MSDDVADADIADVEAVLAGDAAPFAALVRRHQGPVRAVLRGHVGPRADVDDLAQDVFLRAWRALASWRPAKGPFRRWLLAIARNRARDALRRARRRPVAAACAAEPAAAPAKGAAAVPARLDAALAALPPERRVTFLLADVHGLPLEEIATLENVKLGTIKSRLDRARKALRAALAADGDTT